jgi:hypothetical protein
VSYKYECFDTQNNYAMRKLIITGIHVIFTHLYHTAPSKSLIEASQPRNMRKTYHQP